MRETKVLSLNLKDINERGEFTGYLATYGTVDRQKDVVVQGAFTKSLEQTGNKLPLLWMHNDPIGTFEATDHAKGLFIKGTLLPIDEIPLAKYAYLCMKNQVVTSLSIGYEVTEREVKDGVRYLKELNLYEGSLVAVPANPEARITAVKQFVAEGKMADFEQALAAIRVMDSRYQTMRALDESLSSILWDSNLTASQKVTESASSIDQFLAVYIQMLPDLLALWGEKTFDLERKTGRRTSKQDAEAILSVIEKLRALLPQDEVGEDGDGKGFANVQYSEATLARFEQTLLGAF
jgi:hypothetical protein